MSPSNPGRNNTTRPELGEMIAFVRGAGTVPLHEAILRRLTRADTIHPTYQPMIEASRAQRTIFVARYLRNRDLRREINVVE